MHKLLASTNLCSIIKNSTPSKDASETRVKTNGPETTTLDIRVIKVASPLLSLSDRVT